MSRAAETTSQNGSSAPVWLAGIMLPIVLALMLGGSSDTVQLAPDHETSGGLCLLAAALLTIAAVGILISKSTEWPLRQRIATGFLIVLFGFVGMSFLAFQVMEAIYGIIDFPAATTRTFPTLLPIDSAYQQRGKGVHWDIKIYGYSLGITQYDYLLMRAERAPTNPHTGLEKIDSDGYFCARVTVQQSGEALRVLHAGVRLLPENSVVVCPPGTAGAGTH